MKYSEAGKGSSPRKNQDYDSYRDNYDRIFGDKKQRQRAKLDELIHLSEELEVDDDLEEE